MSKRKDGKPRGQYTTEFKLEAVRLVKGGQSASVSVPMCRPRLSLAGTPGSPALGQ